jgi:hypothetical protein
MTVCLVIFLPKYRIYTVYIWFWPTLDMCLSFFTQTRLITGKCYSWQPRSSKRRYYSHVVETLTRSTYANHETFLSALKEHLHLIAAACVSSSHSSICLIFSQQHLTQEMPSCFNPHPDGRTLRSSTAQSPGSNRTCRPEGRRTFFGSLFPYTADKHFCVRGVQGSIDVWLL